MPRIPMFPNCQHEEAESIFPEMPGDYRDDNDAIEAWANDPDNATPVGFRCAVCGQEFTPEEWESLA